MTGVMLPCHSCGGELYDQVLIMRGDDGWATGVCPHCSADVRRTTQQEAVMSENERLRTAWQGYIEWHDQLETLEPHDDSDKAYSLIGVEDLNTIEAFAIEARDILKEN